MNSIGKTVQANYKSSWHLLAIFEQSRRGHAIMPPDMHQIKTEKATVKRAVKNNRRLKQRKD